MVSVVPTNGSDHIFLVSSFGQTLRIDEEQIRPMGRTAAGVNGMKFRSGDSLISCSVSKEGSMLLHLTTEGFGKRTVIDEFSVKGRGGLGVRGIKTTDSRGTVAGSLVVSEDDDILAVTSSGKIIRLAVSEISIQGRDATGVRVMSPGEGEIITAVSPAPTDNEE